MPEFDDTATKRTCVDVSDVLINVASDRSFAAKLVSVKSGKITKVLVIRIILVFVLVSFC